MQHSFVLTKTSWLILCLSACSAASEPDTGTAAGGSGGDGGSGTSLASTTAESGASTGGNGTAELLWGLIIGLARNIPREHQAIRDFSRLTL